MATDNGTNTTAICELGLSETIEQRLFDAKVKTIGQLAERIGLGTLNEVNGIGAHSEKVIRKAFQEYCKRPNTRLLRLAIICVPFIVVILALIAIPARFLWWSTSIFTCPHELLPTFLTVVFTPGVTALCAAILGLKALDRHIAPERVYYAAAIVSLWCVIFLVGMAFCLLSNYGKPIGSEVAFDLNATALPCIQTFCSWSTWLLIAGLGIGTIPTNPWD